MAENDITGSLEERLMMKCLVSADKILNSFSKVEKVKLDQILQVALELFRATKSHE